MLIAQSIATQYGVLPYAQENLPYPEWATLVSGLMDDTPLGRVVAVRSEQDREVIAKMNAWQRKIRTQWREFCAGTQAAADPADAQAQMAGLERMIAKMFGGEANA